MSRGDSFARFSACLRSALEADVGPVDDAKNQVCQADHCEVDDDYRHVSSHDLRRRFAQRLLVDRQMNP